MEDMPAVGGGEDLMGVGAVVAAEGEASRRGIFSFGRTDLAGIFFDVAGLTEAPVGLDREHGHRAAEIVGDEEMLAVGVKADIRRARAP